MRNSGFTVEPGKLNELGRHLIALAGFLQQARAITREVDKSGFGNAQAAMAAEDFAAHWEWQANRLLDVLVDTGNRLQQAARQYQQVEDAQRAIQARAAGK